MKKGQLSELKYVPVIKSIWVWCLLYKRIKSISTFCETCKRTVHFTIMYHKLFTVFFFFFFSEENKHDVRLDFHSFMYANTDVLKS